MAIDGFGRGIVVGQRFILPGQRIVGLDVIPARMDGVSILIRTFFSGSLPLPSLPESVFVTVCVGWVFLFYQLKRPQHPTNHALGLIRRSSGLVVAPLLIVVAAELRMIFGMESQLPGWKNISPAGVKRSLRVVLSKRRTAKACSRSPTCLLICARVQSRRRAAAAMLPVSTILTKLAQLLNQIICQLSIDTTA